VRGQRGLISCLLLWLDPSSTGFSLISYNCLNPQVTTNAACPLDLHSCLLGLSGRKCSNGVGDLGTVTFGSP
uniref:Uncharacterized protein n=1 Tax=Peromyscus maniculatus bairdii TaxID=230844 RepID=A0A8C8UPW9_PERMB